MLAKDSSGKQNRVNLKSPAKSLMLLKATKSVKHKGGEIIEPDSWEYQLLHSWIKSGAPGTAIHESERVRLKKQPEFSGEGVQFFEKKIRPYLRLIVTSAMGSTSARADYNSTRVQMYCAVVIPTNQPSCRVIQKKLTD